jgi:hypothetical protein
MGTTREEEGGWGWGKIREGNMEGDYDESMLYACM